MKTWMANRADGYRAILWDLFLSAVGCFVLRRCFRLVAEAGEDTERKGPFVAVGYARDPLAYVGAALILMALVANEEPGLIPSASELHS